MEIETDWMAARGHGEISFDGLIDFDVNAGPLEKLQGMLGRVGNLFGQITDQIVTYRGARVDAGTDDHGQAVGVAEPVGARGSLNSLHWGARRADGPARGCSWPGTCPRCGRKGPNNAKRHQENGGGS
jgi:hypothetical protein